MFYDIAVIGAGPCGLAVAARLRERTPSALFTQDEHSRYWRKHNRRETLHTEQKRRRKESTDSGYSSANEISATEEDQGPSIIVLDAHSDKWMSSWRSKFEQLDIKHLRSPLFFHPDPRDRDGLLAFAHEQERTHELVEIPNVVGKELSKHEKKQSHQKRRTTKIARHLKIDGRDKIDYFTPSSALFDDYCDDIVQRYKLSNLVTRATVSDLTYADAVSPEGYKLFTLSTSSGSFLSRIVIIATGPSIPASIPAVSCTLPYLPEESASHIFSPDCYVLPPHTIHALQGNVPTNIVVVGGGLTSAQVISQIFKTYPTASIVIHLLLRHPAIKTKPFDISSPWVTKTRNQQLAAFWSADTDAERLEQLQIARNGGSITSGYTKLLHTYVATGKLHIHTSTTLSLDEKCVWSEDTKTWSSLSVTPPPDPSLGPVSHVIYCTGNPTPFKSIPFLRSLNSMCPMETIGPLPNITGDLAWSEDMPCFFTGGLAALRLGPGAANLMGARQGAERVVWAVEEILGSNAGATERNAKAQVERERDAFVASGGWENRYTVLEEPT